MYALNIYIVVCQLDFKKAEKCNLHISFCTIEKNQQAFLNVV